MVLPWGYVLEVVDTRRPGKEIHVGYMNIFFKTKKQAIEYYAAWNPHMRSISNGWSDWDPETYRRYIIRQDFGIEKTIMPFGGELDLPTIVGDETTYKSFAELKKNFP